MTDRDETFAKVAELIAPFNKKGVALAETTTFAGDLEWDSLTVMDFVAAIEDEFDILITMRLSHSRSPAKLVSSLSSMSFLLKGSINSATLAKVSSLSVMPALYGSAEPLPSE